MNMNKIDTLLVEGTFYAPSGYSSATREFMHHYINTYRNEYKNIYLLDQQWDNIRIILPAKYKDTIEKHTIKDAKDIEGVKPDSAMILRWGLPTAFNYDGFAEVPHRIKSIYFVWECDRLPPLWVDMLVYYDIIFTSSIASKNAIELSIRERGMKTPVEIIPHGVADHYYKIEDRHRTLDGFVFLCVGTFHKRKAPMEMISAFLKEFKDEGDKVRLIWKIGGMNDPGQLLVLKREVQKLAFKIGVDMSTAPKVFLDMNTYSQELMNDLYNEASIVVQVSHGEAWGLPILNAMATGTPALTLVKGGHRSYCTKESTYFVKSDGLIYADGYNDWYSRQNGVKWNSINMDDYQVMLRKVYEDDKGRETKAGFSLLIASKFNWNNVVRKAKRIFNKYNKLIDNIDERVQ